jgi:hypothetical protein
VTRGISPSKESQDDDVEVNGNEDDVNEIEEGEADGKSKHRTPLKVLDISTHQGSDRQNTKHEQQGNEK